jgi:hypothetical protein
MTITRQQRLLLASLIIIRNYRAAHAAQGGGGGASAIPGFSIGDFTSEHAADESQMIASTDDESGWMPTCPAGHSGHVHSSDCIMYAM